MASEPGIQTEDQYRVLDSGSVRLALQASTAVPE
jgi:hypothetical protein